MFDHCEILRITRMAVLALLMNCIFGSIAIAAAEETEEVGPPLPAELQQEKKTLKETIVDIEKKMEATHEKLERDIMDQVIRLDDFFGTVQMEHRRKTSYEFRLRNGLRMEEGGKFRPDITLRANMVLPKASENLRLFISGENQVEPLSPALPRDPGNPGFDRTFQPAAKVVNTEFRYRLIEKPNENLFIGAGVKVALPLDPFARLRYEYSHYLGSTLLLRVAETPFIKNSLGLGETTEVSLERALDEKTILRLANSATLSQEFHGMEWGSEISWIRELSAKSAITFTGGIYGSSNPSTVVNNYRLLARYRRNFLTDWLFYELEPEIFWPRDSDGTRAHKIAMTFRLEALFQKAEERN